jgi:integrase
MDFNNMFRRNMMDRLEKAGLEWHGWHAFRRGLATNLSELGVPDHVIQKILRHGDLGTTQRAYRKTRSKEVRKAMKKFSNTVSKSTQGSRRSVRITRDKQGTAS